METVEKQTPRNRRAWTDEETTSFLNCYKLHEHEMSRSRKKMLGYNNILDDLIFMGVPQSPITVAHLQSKMNSLTRAYHRATYMETINGEGSSGFAFMKLMKDIFGSSNESASASSTSGQSTRRATSTLSVAPSSLLSVSSTLTRSPSESELSTNIFLTSTSGQSTLCASSTFARAPTNSTSATLSSTTTSSTVQLAPTSSIWVLPSSNGNLTSQDDSDETKRRVWKYEETRALINCFASREEESRHPKKGKNVFKNILEDLESMNVLTAPTTEINVKQKWDRLLDAYKTASDAEILTGRGSSTFMYMDCMDEIFSDRPIMANSHTVNLYGENIEAVPLRSKILPVDENDTDNDEETIFRAFPPEEDVIFIEVPGGSFEQIETNYNTKNVENDITLNAQQVVPRNVLQISDPTNDAASKNVPTDPILNTATTVHSISSEEAAGFSFGIIGSNECILVENIAASTAKPAVTKSTLRTLTTKNSAGATAKNVQKKQIPNQTTPTASAGGKDTRSLLRAKMGLDDKNVDVSKEPKMPIGSNEEKSKKLPYSFRRTKTGKEIVQEKRESWEKEKLKRKSEARMEQLRFLEEKKQKRHEERCQVMAKYLEKL